MSYKFSEHFPEIRDVLKMCVFWPTCIQF